MAVHLLYNRIQQVGDDEPVQDRLQHIYYCPHHIRQIGGPEQRKIKHDAGCHHEEISNSPAELLPDPGCPPAAPCPVLVLSFCLLLCHIHHSFSIPRI